MPEQTGKTLRLWRENHNFSIEQAAEILKVVPATIRYYENMRGGDVRLPQKIRENLKAYKQENPKPPNNSLTGEDLQVYLATKKWNVYDAERELHIPWTEIRDCLIWKNQKLPEKIIKAVQEYEKRKK